MIQIDCKREYLEYFINKVTVDCVYLESIVQGYQDGEIYVDNTIEPKACLFWHKCGFG